MAHTILGLSVELVVCELDHGRKIYLTRGELYSLMTKEKARIMVQFIPHSSIEEKYSAPFQLLMVDIQACIKCNYVDVVR